VWGGGGGGGGVTGHRQGNRKYIEQREGSSGARGVNLLGPNRGCHCIRGWFKEGSTESSSRHTDRLEKEYKGRDWEESTKTGREVRNQGGDQPNTGGGGGGEKEDPAILE